MCPGKLKATHWALGPRGSGQHPSVCRLLLLIQDFCFVRCLLTSEWNLTLRVNSVAFSLFVVLSGKTTPIASSGKKRQSGKLTKRFKRKSTIILAHGLTGSTY